VTPSRFRDQQWTVSQNGLKSAALLTSPECERLCVVLVRTRNPLNIGAAARAMSNFGFSRLRVVKPYEASFREARSAVGASAVLADAEEFASVVEAVADCRLVVGTTAVRRRELQHSLKDLQDGALVILGELGRKELRRNKLSMTRLDETGGASPRVAILFGSEKTGLSNQALSHCHWLMRIPTSERNISMNLGQAVAVCLYELARGGKPSKQSTRRERAASGEIERITMLLLEALRASGYLAQPAATNRNIRGDRSGSGALADEKLRRLIRRLDLSAVDAQIWLGILRQIAWKLRSPQDCASPE
jgi:TrmH family RNA methyltransferase